MPDVRLDAITTDISELSSAWINLVTAVKLAEQPRDTADLLDAGIPTLRAQINELNASLFKLPIKDIAIDLHTEAT